MNSQFPFSIGFALKETKGSSYVLTECLFFLFYFIKRAKLGKKKSKAHNT